MQKVCIIIPCFNEEKRFPKIAFKEYIAKNDIHFCLVNDGSSDNTISVLEEIKVFSTEKITVIDKKNNEGKAEAVRSGMKQLLSTKKYNYIGFFDADLATPLEEITNLLEKLKGNCQLVFGSRIKRLGSTIKRSAKRHYLGRVFATLASKILNLGIYDTQCGAKIMSIELAEIASKEKFYSKWFFDIEMFARIINSIGAEQLKKIAIEVPLNNWDEKGGSKIKMKDFLKVPFELYKIKRIYIKPNHTNKTTQTNKDSFKTKDQCYVD